MVLRRDAAEEALRGCFEGGDCWTILKSALDGDNLHKWFVFIDKSFYPDAVIVEAQTARAAAQQCAKNVRCTVFPWAAVAYRSWLDPESDAYDQ